MFLLQELNTLNSVELIFSTLIDTSAAIDSLLVVQTKTGSIMFLILIFTFVKLFLSILTLPFSYISSYSYLTKFLKILSH